MKENRTKPQLSVRKRKAYEPAGWRILRECHGDRLGQDGQRRRVSGDTETGGLDRLPVRAVIAAAVDREQPQQKPAEDDVQTKRHQQEIPFSAHRRHLSESSARDSDCPISSPA